jgi:hypothetical protein
LLPSRIARGRSVNFKKILKVILVIIIAIIGLILFIKNFVYIGTTLQSTQCIALSPLKCISAELNTKGQVSLSFAQLSEENWYNVSFSCVIGNVNSTFSPKVYTYNLIQSNISSYLYNENYTVIKNLTCYAPNGSEINLQYFNGTKIGYIWITYMNSNGTPKNIPLAIKFFS